MNIIDSHTHWGHSLSLLGVNVTSDELLQQAQQSGVERVVIFPFPSTAIANKEMNDSLLEEAKKNEKFIPYWYIPEDLQPIPKEKGFLGGKWHWIRGVQDCSSNYDLLKDPQLKIFIEESEKTDLPIVFEEELSFTENFVKMTNSLKVIIPHMGMLGGNPLDFLETFKTVQNVYFDTSLAGKMTISKFIEKIGPERIIFGSDIPFGIMKHELEKILSLSLEEAKKELILSRNIKRLIGI